MEKWSGLDTKIITLNQGTVAIYFFQWVYFDGNFPNLGLP